MNKKTTLWVLLDLVFLIVFNTVFFVIGGANHPASVWISYAFIHLAYFMVLATPFLIRKSSKAFVFGFALTSISSAYFLIEFVVGLIFIILKDDSYKPALVVQIIIAGIYAVMLLSHLIANEHTADSVERHEEEVSYIKGAASRVRALMDKSSDKKANKQVEAAYDVLHSSPTKTTAALHSLENDILNKISELEDAVASGDTDRTITTAAEVVNLTEERNRKLRLAN